MNKNTFRDLTLVASTWLVFGVPLAEAASNDEPKAGAPPGFVWVAPEGCPTEEEANARVRERLPPSTPPVANARVDKNGEHYRLVLEIPSVGERVLEAATCDELVASMAVVLAMSLAPMPEPAVEQPRPGAVRAASESSVPHEATPDARPSPSPSHFGVRGQAVVDVGTLPTAAMGGGIALGFDPIANVHVEATTNLYAAQDGTLADDPSRGATFHLVTAGARGGWILLRKPELGPCLGADVAVLSAQGFGSDVAKKATSVTWSPDVSIFLRARISSFLRIVLGAGAGVPTSTPTFRIAGAGPVHRSSSTAARAWFGPELVF